MRLIRLSCDCYANPEEVQEMKVNASSDTITVRMQDGIGHSVTSDYGKGVYATADRLRAELEGQPDPVE